MSVPLLIPSGWKLRLGLGYDPRKVRSDGSRWGHGLFLPEKLLGPENFRSLTATERIPVPRRTTVPTVDSGLTLEVSYPYRSGVVHQCKSS